jgi:hypothetical protein
LYDNKILGSSKDRTTFPSAGAGTAAVLAVSANKEINMEGRDMALINADLL